MLLRHGASSLAVTRSGHTPAAAAHMAGHSTLARALQEVEDAQGKARAFAHAGRQRQAAARSREAGDPEDPAMEAMLAGRGLVDQIHDFVANLAPAPALRPEDPASHPAWGSGSWEELKAGFRGGGGMSNYSTYVRIR